MTQWVIPVVTSCRFRSKSGDKSWLVDFIDTSLGVVDLVFVLLMKFDPRDKIVGAPWAIPSPSVMVTWGCFL